MKSFDHDLLALLTQVPNSPSIARSSAAPSIAVGRRFRCQHVQAIGVETRF